MSKNLSEKQKTPFCVLGVRKKQLEKSKIEASLYSIVLISYVTPAYFYPCILYEKSFFGKEGRKYLSKLFLSIDRTRRVVI